MKTIRILLILVLISFLIGCVTTKTPTARYRTASHFYGIKMKSSSYADRFTIERYSISKGVSFSYLPSKMDSNVSAFGKISGSIIKITVTNKSNNPIPTNYFSDTFTLITTDNKTYYLEKGDILEYPNQNYINPGSTVYYKVKKPFGDLRKEHVSKIVCDFGVISKTSIVLVPLPYPDDLNKTVNK